MRLISSSLNGMRSFAFSLDLLLVALDWFGGADGNPAVGNREFEEGLDDLHVFRGGVVGDFPMRFGTRARPWWATDRSGHTLWGRKSLLKFV